MESRCGRKIEFPAIAVADETGRTMMKEEKLESGENVLSIVGKRRWV